MVAPSLARRAPAIPAADVVDSAAVDPDDGAPARARAGADRAARRLRRDGAEARRTACDVPPGRDERRRRSRSSQSVTDRNYRRIANTLAMLSKSGGALGAVAFSDIAYELMPPGSPPSEVQSLIRFFKPIGRDQSGRFDLTYPANPWNELFSAGTSVSTGSVSPGRC